MNQSLGKTYLWSGGECIRSSNFWRSSLKRLRCGVMAAISSQLELGQMILALFGDL